MFRSFVRSSRFPLVSTNSFVLQRSISSRQFQAIVRPSFAASTLNFSSSNSLPFVTTATFCTVERRDTKAAFQAGNVEETLAKWEKEANIHELNLSTEKLGLDRKRYKDISVQMSDIITLRTKLLGNEHPETLYSNAILAAIYRVVGKHKSATNIIKQVLATIESQLGDTNSARGHSQKDLYMLYASCVEEFGRIHLAGKEPEFALRAVERGSAVLSEYISRQNKDDFLVYLALLHNLSAEICLEMNKYNEGQKCLDSSRSIIDQIPKNVRLPYFLLNHWRDKATAVFRNNLLSAKFHAHLGELEEAASDLEEAHDVLVKNKGSESIELCNTYLELLDIYARMVPDRVSVEMYVRTLKSALVTTRTMDKILRETRGVDKRVVYPYYQTIQRGLRTLLNFDDQKAICISLLFECLRIHEKYPAIYPTTEEDLFTKVMSLIQLLREEKQFTQALELITKYKEQFTKLKDHKPDYVIPLIEIQAQLIVNSCFGDKPPTPSKSGTIPLGEQMKVTTQTRDAVEGLEFIANFYKKKKNKEGTIRTLHTLAIVETLQEEYSYAEQKCYQCIKMIDPSYAEYLKHVDVSTDRVPLPQVARLCDLLILRGSLLRVQHEPTRAINHYTAALELLTISRQNLTDNTILKIKDDLTRASDILRCLDYMMDITKSTLNELQESQDTAKIEETKKFLQSCKKQHESVTEELNRLHARLKNRENQTDDVKNASALQ